jgi:low affinity Fe/Cu permease
MQKLFIKWASKSAQIMGSPWAFFSASTLILLWALSGPLFGYSDTWELIINTVTTIITFLMVFLIQNTQNRDARAMHLKLDELIFSQKGADNKLLNIEELSVEELDQLAVKYQQLQSHYEAKRDEIRRRRRRLHHKS